MSTWKATVLLFAILGLLFGPVLQSRSASGAQLGVFDSVEGSFGEGPEIFKVQDVAQSFRASTDYRLVRIDAMLYDLDPSNGLNLTIQTDAAGVPSGVVLSWAGGDGVAGYDWVVFNLAIPIPVTGGQVYWIVLLDPIGMNQPNGYKWGVKTPDQYPNGAYAIRNGGGSWTPTPGGDLLFRAWGLQGPQVAAGLQVDASTAGGMDPLTYTLHFNNSGTAPASYVWTNLTISPNTTFESDTAGSIGGMSLGPTSWQFLDVGLGSHYFVVNVRVQANVFDGLRMDAILTVEYANETEVTQERTQATVTVTARAPSITLAKSVNPKFLGPGENLTYSISIVNSGSRPSPRVWVNDTLPLEVIYLTNDASLLANVSAVTWDGATLRVNFTDLPRGTFTFTIAAQTRAGLLNGTAFTNLATADYADSRGIVVMPTASATATARIHGASIQVAKSANVALVGPGQEVRYRIRYDNRGNAVARSAWINDTLPPEVDYVSDTAGGTLVGSVVRFSFVNVSIGLHSLTITARVRNGTLDGTTIVNSVSLSYTNSDGGPASPSNAGASVLVVLPFIAFSLSAPTTADPGDQWDLQIAATNLGNATAAGVWVNLTLPTGLTQVGTDAGAQGGTATPDGWFFADVAPGVLTFHVQMSVSPGLADGSLLTANVWGAFFDALNRVAEPSPAAMPVAITAPSLTLAISLSRSSVGIGQTVLFTIDYANTGAGVASDVWLNVSVPSGVEVVSASEPWVATSGLRYTWHIVGLASVSRQLRVTLRPDSTLGPGSQALAAEIEFADANGNMRTPVSRATSVVITNLGWSAGTIAFLILLASVASLSVFIGYKVYGLGTRDKAEIQQVFLLHKSGLLIKHYTRHLHGSLDTDILAAMIVAVQNFVRESFRFRAGDLEEMKFGPHKILLVHGRYAILAAVVSGSHLDRLKSVLKFGAARLEEEFGGTLADWSGVVDELQGLDELLDQILRGKIPTTNGTRKTDGLGGP